MRHDLPRCGGQTAGIDNLQSTPASDRDRSPRVVMQVRAPRRHHAADPDDGV
jgi:hypothetical protein